MELDFTKMHGAGNDFIVINAILNDVSHFTESDWRALANRQFGIGADQILLVEAPTIEGVDFKYSIYNQDGSMVENCGNGARCFVKYVHDNGLTRALPDPREVRVQIATGQMRLRLNDDGSVTVNMGAPKCEPSVLPAIIEGLETNASGDDLLYGAVLDGGTVRWLSLVSMGNPHAVQVVVDVDAAPVVSEGAQIEMHPMFPRKVNAGFMQIVTPNHIKVRIFERGAGETLACGTGACAAVVAGIRQGLLKSPVRVSARGGELNIAWDNTKVDSPVMMTGPAVTVFTGRVTV